MNEQEMEPIESMAVQDATELAAAQVADLELPGGKASEIAAGHGVTVLAWARVEGVSAPNHNETVSYDEADLEEFKDLPPIIAQETDIIGGASPILMQHCASGQH